jgi:hypothetical protein
MLSVPFGVLSSLELFSVLLQVLLRVLSVCKYECLVLLFRPPVARFLFCTHMNRFSIFNVTYKIFIENFEASAAGG